MISRRRLAFVCTLAVAVGLLAAFAVASQADRDDTFEAIAIIGVARAVPNDELDAERQAMIDRLESDRIDQVLVGTGAVEIQFIMPEARSSIAVVARAPTGPPASDAAETVASEIAALEAASSAAPLDERVATLESRRPALDSERDTRQLEINALIRQEATATVPLAGFLPDDDRTELQAELQSIQEQLILLRAERDLVVDEANALRNDRLRAEVARVTEVREPFVIEPTAPRNAAEDVVRSALVTFAVATVATAVGCLTLTSPRRTA